MINANDFRSNPDAFDIRIGIENSKGKWDGTFNAVISCGKDRTSERVALTDTGYTSEADQLDTMNKEYCKARAYGFRWASRSPIVPDAPDSQDNWPEVTD